MKKNILMVIAFLSIAAILVFGYRYVHRLDNQQVEFVEIESPEVDPEISVEDEESESNVVIQSIGCSANDGCSSGHCVSNQANIGKSMDYSDAISGHCKPCIANCSKIPCQNDGDCCDGTSCLVLDNDMRYCSDGSKTCACYDNGDCESAPNCFGGICVGCYKKGMACSGSDTCCDGMSCLDGACFDALPLGRACTSSGECKSKICVNNTCSCADDSCACNENNPSTCNSGYCEAGLCQHKDIAAVVGGSVGASIAGAVGVKSFGAWLNPAGDADVIKGSGGEFQLDDETTQMVLDSLNDVESTEVVGDTVEAGQAMWSTAQTVGGVVSADAVTAGATTETAATVGEVATGATMVAEVEA